MDVMENYVMQKESRKEKSICPSCIHHNLCIAENNQPCFECNRFIDANGVTVQEWISVYDKLPEPGERVLATDGGFAGEFYINSQGQWQRYNVNNYSLLMALDILWWMPLPEPPKEDKLWKKQSTF